MQALETEKEQLIRWLTYDYGADEAWLPLVNKCVEARGSQYSYRICLFEKVAQVDTNAGHETSLGKWKGFENQYSEVCFFSSCHVVLMQMATNSNNSE